MRNKNEYSRLVGIVRIHFHEYSVENRLCMLPG
jgi:hypothetical protein